jgi:glycosyltransferase involved in cell wall biosynthesis
MVSFHHKMAAGLQRRGIEVGYELGGEQWDALLVVGGTRRLDDLWRARWNGVPVVQRLDGINWLHRLRHTGLRHWLRAEYGNWLLRTIRDRFANRVVYQSAFARDWWQRVYGTGRAPASVVHNGVDLDAYSPDGPHTRPDDRWRILLVEGSLMGGYEMGLETAVALAEALSDRIAGLPEEEERLNRPVELMVVGRVSPELKSEWNLMAGFAIRWAGQVPPERIPEIDRSAHLLYSADLNAACPNAVIEALACGLPALAFDTGALPELVTGEAGAVVPYGGDPWRLDPPDVDPLAGAALRLIAGGEAHRRAARELAEAAFGLERMLDGYLDALGA